LIFKGNERLDLIDRLSSNQVNKLHELQGLKTILTTDKGRFIDLLTLYVFDDFVFSTCSYNNSSKVRAHLDKYTIMDDFQCKDMSGTHETILFFGTNAEKFAKEVYSTDIRKLMNNDFYIVKENRYDVIVSRNDDAFGGLRVIYPAEAKEDYFKKYLSDIQNKKYDLHQIDNVTYDMMRIELGMPAFGNEMNEDTNPLECSLNKYVSFTKGCYIGQEVIARLDTYDKISKHLVGLKIEQEVSISQSLDNSAILKDYKECGYVTSSTHSKRFGNIALGFIKTPFLDYNSKYILRTENNSISCGINKLPF
jgi:folate-binding protein YgfZ